VTKLAQDFPAPAPEQWQRLTERVLKGASADTLESETLDGLRIRPLYRPGPGPRLEARPATGSDPERPWDLRVGLGRRGAAGANSEALEHLRGGAASLLVNLDPREGGLAALDPDTLALVLDGVLLELAPVALDAGLHGPLAANALAVLAKGAPNAKLAFHLDPASFLLRHGRTPGPAAAHLSAAVQTGLRHMGAYPHAQLFMASGRVVHEAGGSEAQELGVMLASLIDWLRALEAAGLPPEQAAARIVIGLSSDAQVFLSVAKLRAARAMVARVFDQIGVSHRPVIEVRSSRRMLASRDLWTNLLRLTAAAFAAGTGGADAVVLDGFTEPLGGESDLARRQKRNIQLVLMEEAHLGRVDDPMGSSAFIESLTDDLARAGWAFMQRIEAAGGLWQASESGLISDGVMDSRERLLAEVRDGRRPVLGVTLYPDAHEQVPGVDVEPRLDESLWPEVRHDGPDSRCPALEPVRLEQVAPDTEAAQ
jgi:methylmalonyl-CoA mutase